MQQPYALSRNEKRLQQRFGPGSGPVQRRNYSAHFLITKPTKLLTIILCSLPQNLVPTQVSKRTKRRELRLAFLLRV
ncbi:hypothetical protein HanPSC8_Chr02g0080191 [Helianthus annuus]|nr:hypothetical protein HanHA89_Chr02g0077521 [Helianthus annuus]KAJ0953110.1 hypothetical protein HanPSC8_Chr02g0080191 [Helianthus annuus]